MEYKPHQVEKLMGEGGGPIRDAIKQMKAKRLVIDSITAYGMLFKDEYERRENILDLFDYLHKWGCTSLIISELPPKVAEVKEGSVGFLTDAIISLYYSKQHESGERVRQLPLFEDYLEEVKGERADFRSLGKTRFNGTIFAGAFLSKFVGDTPFIHLDVAGTAMLDEPKDYQPKDGSGFGVRLAIEFLENL